MHLALSEHDFKSPRHGRKAYVKVKSGDNYVAFAGQMMLHIRDQLRGARQRRF